MPPNVTKLPDNDPEVRTTATVATTTVNPARETIGRLLQHFSSWRRLTKAVAWLLRFGSYYLGIKKEREAKLLSVEETETASKSIVKYVQTEMFSGAIKQLPNHDDFNPSNFVLQNKRAMHQDPALHSLRMLSPILVQGILRVGGRLQRSELPDETKHPIILPTRHHVTELIINFYHEREGHSGTLHTLACVRERYWVIRGQTTVRNAIKKCVLCRSMKVKPCGQIMAPLPSVRLHPGNPPFTCVGVDYMGPLVVKRARSQVKRFGCVFTCLATRAVHLEIAYSLETSSFLQAFHRFTARRSPCKELYSDNGSKFTGAERELREGIAKWNQDTMHQNLQQVSISWHFNPPASSHRGGIWERIICSVRSIVTALVGSRLLDDESLQTLFAEVERILNNRPITPISDDPRDTACLTPSMLIHTKLDPCLPAEKFIYADGYKKAWRTVQWLADRFWQRWLKEYVTLLQLRQKWLKPERNLAAGDLVLLVDSNLKRGHWQKGIVEKVLPDAFNVVRAVKVRTATGSFVRDIRKVCLLETAK